MDDVGYNFNPATQTPAVNYVNNRLPTATYDAEGNTLNADQQTYVYTTGGEMFKAGDSKLETEKYFDGDGQEVKRQVREKNTVNNIWEPWFLTYRLKSTVFGKDIGEFNPNGTKAMTFVYNGGNVIAIQQSNAIPTPFVRWQHADSSGTTTGYSMTSTIPIASQELDAEGMSIRTIPPDPETGTNSGMIPPVNGGVMNSSHGDIDAILHGGCFLDGTSVSCDTANSMLRNGAADHAPTESIRDSIKRLNDRRAAGNRQAPTLKNRNGQKRPAVLPYVGHDDDPIGSQSGQLPNKHPDKWIQDIFKLKIGKMSRFEKARYFLQNKTCRDAFNSILAQLSKDTGINLEGDIEYYIDQLEKTGTIEVEDVGNSPNAGGTTLAPDYGTPGWGISYAETSGTGNIYEEFSRCMNTLVGETVHAIGRRNGKSNFSDLNAHRTLVNMGIAESMEETVKLPYFNNPRYKNEWGELVQSWVASSVWHNYTTWKCGHPNYKSPTPGIK